MDNNYDSAKTTVETTVVDSKVIDQGILRKLLVKAGRSVALPAIETLEILLDPSSPPQVKLTMFAALTYLLTPFDLIPDIVPVAGFSDDLVALTAVISIWKSYLTPNIQARARHKLDKWLPLIR